ncbi:MAG: ATP-binding protein [Trichlorobacter sp.]|uniref:hybrid sensor histidine kinase/response regulator n=1 Tax=Trichlorobacter sp. TaxID=2911007 RepID=UPI00255EAFFE|nr:ATP-binding protein [Trichlorobacter sp.]MDK9716424.1 ATP-binding protein [Trichlorobacter sp.]
MIYLALIQNIALMVALTFLHGLLLRRIRHQGLGYALVSGLLFGGVALVGIMTPMILQPGLIFDGRSIIIAVAGLFGGPITAGVAAAMAAGYRYWLGGVGAAMGIAVIIGAGGIGVIGYYLRRRHPGLAGLPGMYLFGLLVHLWMIGCTVLLPSAVIAKTLATITLPVLVIYPLATLLVCQLFLQMERHIIVEQALEAERASLNSLIQAIPDLLFELGLDGRYYACYARQQELLVVPAEQLLGRTVQDMLPPQAAGVCLDALQEAVATGHSHGRQFVLPSPTGELWFELSVARKTGVVTDQPRFVVLSRDISDRKQHEKELLAARYAAEAANRVKSEFLANMSHEIRTPLNGLLGMVQLMRYTELSREQEEYLQNMELCSSTLLSLISDILDLSKIEAGRIELEQTTFPIRLVLEEVVAIQSATARQKSLQLELDLADDLPEQMQGDPLRFKQIILNPLGNAIKFTPQGTVKVSASCLLPEEDKPARLQIAVRDTGVGISEEQQKQIFAPFTQADGTITRKFGGSGLGLAICKRLTELMGGKIRVASELGKGSCFLVELPIVKDLP